MSVLGKISTLAQTVRYLKSRQVVARCVNMARRRFPVRVDWTAKTGPRGRRLTFVPFIPSPDSYYGRCEFEFLNLRKDFSGKLDWEWAGYGKLWTYNLNYFDFINQTTISRGEALALINDFTDNIAARRTGLEPYPTSLRVINLIRFLSLRDIRDAHLDELLWKQLRLLTRNIEYHLMGNHLLENGFAMLFGAYYFNDRPLYDKAVSILRPELEEQILPDGAHFELSPMYHSLMLLRVLDCLNLVEGNDSPFGVEIGPLLREKSRVMLGWLNAVSFRDGSIPLFNDAAFGVAPTVGRLREYAAMLGIVSTVSPLKESGYRKLATDHFELVVDVAMVGPDYQPGHAHADTLGFELHIHGRPVLVDTGTSTYQIDDYRSFERSTAAHNTVAVGGRNSSNVWAGHRVAQRARVTIAQDTPRLIAASHDGYRSIGIIHGRTLSATAPDRLVIEDRLMGRRNAEVAGTAWFHFHPSEAVTIEGERISGRDWDMVFEGGEIEIIPTKQYYAPQFNKRIPTIAAAVSFNDKLQTTILTKDSVEV